MPLCGQVASVLSMDAVIGLDGQKVVAVLEWLLDNGLQERLEVPPEFHETPRPKGCSMLRC